MATIRLFHLGGTVDKDFTEVEADIKYRQPIMYKGVLYTAWHRSTIWEGVNFRYVEWYYPQKEIFYLAD